MRNNINGNAAQMEAILHGQGPAMVLAGPGSGKTFVIVRRLLHLIVDLEVDPASILVITFTKAAAIEMQQRFMKLSNSAYPEVGFGTFHSIFYQIIRGASPKDHTLEIASESFKYKLLKDIIETAAGRQIISKEEALEGLELLKDIISEISRIKNMGLDPSFSQSGIPLKQHFPYIFKEYNKSLKEYNSIDFDDMILSCYELLRNNKELLDMYSRKYQYFLIDEYQDINLMQYKVVRLLCRSNNLFVVGDDDQSIYGFRGSDPVIMQKFPDEFKKSMPKIINLDTNYRCGKQILENALLVIEQNKERYQKLLRADSSNGLGYVIPRSYANKDSQNRAILTFLNEHIDDLDKIAFIFRTNSEALSIANLCKSAGIPTNLENVSKSFADSSAVRLCMDYLSFAYFGHRREHFYRIMNKPMRYISRDCVTKEKVREEEVLRFYSGNSGKTNEIKRFFRQLSMLEHMRPSLNIRFLRNEMGIDKLFPGEIDALNELSEMAAKEQDNRFLLEKLLSLREKSDEEGKQKNKNIGKGKKLNLLTMHGSKGLEFDIVWLPNLNEGIIPSRSSVTPSQIEEERRMLYVGMTRAKTALIMSYLSGTENNPMLPSRFLRPIRHLWENRKNYSSPSRPSSGSSMISSNSTSSR